MITLIASIIIAFSNNEAGGRIALTNERGDCPAGELTVITFASTGDYAVGCWIWSNELIVARWSDGSRKIYIPDNFELTEEAKK